MKHASFSHGHVHFTVGVGMRQINLTGLVPGQSQHCQGASSLFLRKTLFLTTSLQERHTHMEHRKSPLDNENKRRQKLSREAIRCIAIRAPSEVS